MAEYRVSGEFLFDGGASMHCCIYYDLVWRKSRAGERMEDTGWTVKSGCACAAYRDGFGGMLMDRGHKRRPSVANARQAYLYDHDNRFFVGWELGKSWVLVTVSWTVLLINATSVVAAKYLVPKEHDYEPIPDIQ